MAATNSTPLSSTSPSAAPPLPLLSILNVVVDHVMMTPSPLEPKEFAFVEEMAKKNEKLQEPQQLQQQDERSSLGKEPAQPPTTSLLPMATKNSCIQVPILRVFGPVLKDGDCGHYIDNDSDCSSSSDKITHRRRQPQSGCLHIHGAYPYMLTRPVVAGPDGSMYPQHHRGHPSNAMNNTCNHDGRIDWDDACSVATILDEIHFRLEMALRVSYEHHHGISKNSSNIKNANTSKGGNVVDSVATAATSSADTAKNNHDNIHLGNDSKNETSEQSSHQSQKMPLFVRRVSIVIGRGFYTYCPGPAAPFLRVEYYDPSMRWRVKMILERGLELNDLYHPDPARYDYEDILDESHDGREGRGIAEFGRSDIRQLKFRCYEAHIPYTMQVFKDYNLAGMKYIKVGNARFRNPVPKSLRKRTREEFQRASKHDCNLEDDAYFLSCTVSTDLLWPPLDDAIGDSGASLEKHWLKKQSSCDLEFDCTVQQLLDVLDVMTELPQNLDERQKVHWRAVPSLREIWEQERKRMSVLLPPENDFLSGLSKEEETTNYDEESSSLDSSDSEDGNDVMEQRMKDHVPSATQFTLNVKKGASVPGTRLAVKGIQQLFRTSCGLETDFRRALRDIVLRHEPFINGGTHSGDILTNHASKDTSMFTPDLNEGIEALAALCDQFSQNSAAAEEDSGRLLQNDVDPETSSKSPIASYLSAQRKCNVVPLSQEDAEDEIEMLSFGQRVDSGGVHSSLFAPHFDEDATIFDEEDDDFLAEEEQLGEKGFELALTQLATQTIEPGNDSSSLLDSMSHSFSHPSFKCDDNDLFSDDDGDHDLQMNEVANEHSPLVDTKVGLSVLSQPSDGALNVENIIFEECDSTTRSHTQASGDGFSQSPFLELPTCRFVAVPRTSCRLRCGVVMNVSASASKPWYAPPSLDSETCPPWFSYRWKSSGAPPLIPSSHIEPVKQPPSFSQVKSWLRAQKKRTELPQNCPPNKQSKVRVGTSVRSSPSLTAYTQYSQFEEAKSEETSDPLSGLGHQGGRVQVSSGGGMKTQVNTSSTYTPLTIMSIEVHVQCRICTRAKDQNEIAMVPNSSRDAIFAVAYVFGSDPGGGESLEIFDKGCVLVSTDLKTCPNVITGTMGLSSDVSLERVDSERNLLLRIASLVQQKDPDALVSWDTQGGGLGFLVERGVALGQSSDDSKSAAQIDMARLLGRTPRVIVHNNFANDISKVTSSNLGEEEQQQDNNQLWSGSGLGGEWDEMVGAGTAASSIMGRIVMCAWKICSEECKHPNASYQPAIVSSVLNKRIPYHDDIMLTKWYSADNGVERWRVVEYRLAQAMSNVLLLDALDILGRAGEAARLSGVEFSQSLPGIRGSQYKVEGVLLRALQSVQSNERGEKNGVNKAGCLTALSLTSSHESQSQSQSPWKLRRNKTRMPESGPLIGCDDDCINEKDMGYFFYSPSKVDCSNQEALECQAMTLEPESGFHFDPVVVCDFTALYPSLVIAYNFCYSTVAGKLDYHSTRQEMRCTGRTTSKVGPFFYSERRSAAVVKHHMKMILDSDDAKSKAAKRRRDRAYAIPTGSIFVSESVQKGVLPQVLDEMLSTRAMLKKAAKLYKQRVNGLSPSVLRQIEARQLALKYVANVTYGYTSATFSGRSAIPLVADAIVECGRRTLTNAIDLANRWGREENGRWSGAYVLYGDTDSVFIKLPGRSVQEAFRFGEEYCKTVTSLNPPPVSLKLEKVYSQCLLQTKKKYCGLMFESPTQKQPSFEAKGIETVRRDQCTVTQRILKNALTLAFSNDLSSVKDYLHRQWALIHSGNLPVSDFVLTGRVRSRYRGGKIGPVQASLARRLAEIDPGRVVRHKERLPYVIVAMPGRAFKLKDGVFTPLELLEQWDSYSVNAEYYTVRHVNASLQRCFGLPPFNVNIHAWYDSCPKPRRRIHHWPQSKSASSLMISSYFGSDICALCGRKYKSVGSSKVVVCHHCKIDNIAVACTAIERLKMIQMQANQLASICSSCNGCLENSGTFARVEIPKRHDNGIGVLNRIPQKPRLCTPIANCVCIDCPITFERHKIRECEIEAVELYQASVSF